RVLIGESSGGKRNHARCQTADSVHRSLRAGPAGTAEDSPPPVLSDQLGLREDVPVHRLLEIFLGSARGQLQRRVEGVELEEIPMGARRGAGSAVADPM